LLVGGDYSRGVVAGDIASNTTGVGVPVAGDTVRVPLHQARHTTTLSVACPHCLEGKSIWLNDAVPPT
jgi:hypothetical protein